MRQIEKAMCAAVEERRNWRNSNTEVSVSKLGTVHVYLHGNCIYASYPNGEKQFSLAGWNTVTTRSRLAALGVSVRQKNYTPIYNGEAISSTAWITC